LEFALVGTRRSSTFGTPPGFEQQIVVLVVGRR
jgi:hypothetical protein